MYEPTVLEGFFLVSKNDVEKRDEEVMICWAKKAPVATGRYDMLRLVASYFFYLIEVDGLPPFTLISYGCSLFVSRRSQLLQQVTTILSPLVLYHLRFRRLHKRCRAKRQPSLHLKFHSQKQELQKP